MTLDLLSLLCIVGVIQLLLIAATFATSSTLPRRVFAAFALVLAIVIAGAVAEANIAGAPRLHLPFNFLIAPLFYLFVRSVVRGEPGRRVWLHALPMVAGLSDSVDLPLLLLQGMVYLMLIFRLLRGSREHLLWAGAFAMTGCWAVAFLRFAGVPPVVVPTLFSISAVVIVAMLLRDRASVRERTKYAHSTLTDDRGERYLRKLVDFFDHEKPFLDSNLSLASVSQRLTVPSGHLSQIVNQRLGRNFNDWVNGYRVEEAKGLLTDPRAQHLSIVAIGEKSGFRSRSAFHAAFRKATGMSPSEYRRSE